MEPQLERLMSGFRLKIKLPEDLSTSATAGSTASQGAATDNTDIGERT